MQINKKITFILLGVVMFIFMFAHLNFLYVYFFHILSLPLGDLIMFMLHMIACIPLVYVLVVTKNLKMRPLYIIGYFVLIVFVIVAVQFDNDDLYRVLNYQINLVILLIFALYIVYAGCTKLGKIYLPIIMIVFLPSILARYDIITYHARPYFVVGTSVILQILISIIAAIYSAKHGIGKWHNLIFGTVSFSVTNLLAAFVSYIHGDPLWYIVFPLPYIITSLITMHFVKPRKVLTENSEAVAAE